MSRLRLMKLKEVMDVTGISKSSIYALMEIGLFPRSVSLEGVRLARWEESEVQAFIAARIALRAPSVFSVSSGQAKGA